jgi:hypothetical protein
LEIGDDNSPTVDGDDIESESNATNLETTLLSTAQTEVSAEERASSITEREPIDLSDSTEVAQPETATVEATEPNTESINVKQFQFEVSLGRAFLSV